MCISKNDLVFGRICRSCLETNQVSLTNQSFNMGEDLTHLTKLLENHLCKEKKDDKYEQLLANINGMKNKLKSFVEKEGPSK